MLLLLLFFYSIKNNGVFFYDKILIYCHVFNEVCAFISKYYFFEKVNKCSKGIGLETIFKIFYGKRLNLLSFFTTFNISHESSIKFFLK